MSYTMRGPVSSEQVTGFSQQDLRDRFLVQNLLTPGEVQVVPSHFDRAVAVGAVPTHEPLQLLPVPEIRSEFFLEHREIGIANVGGSGRIIADGTTWEMAPESILYLGRGTQEVTFHSEDPEQPAAFYGFSAPAHAEHPSAVVTPEEGTIRELGDQLTSNRRTLRQCIHRDGVRSCQVVMGITRLHPGSMWNTMPAHTHDRRTEFYLYFDVPEGQRVVHLMGEPEETRHIITGDRDVVMSPSWSIHSGVGTGSYAFVWAMAGENQAFDDMDHVHIADMR